jgi:hypothetical protein
VLTTVILATWETEIRGGSRFKASPGKKQDPISKIPNTKQTGGVAQVVECLPSKPEALNSNSNTGKKKTNKKNTLEV